MSQTVDEITQNWLRLLTVKQVGEPLTAQESLDGLQALNELIEQMNLQSYFQTSKKQITQALTSNDGTYTFGTGGDNSTRPLEIFTAYVKDSNDITFPIQILMNEEYSEIRFKSVTSSYPYNLYYRAEYPLGVAELYPIPSSNNLTLYLETRAALSTYTSGSDVVDLPPGYMKYIKFQLAVDNGPEYKEASASVRDTAMKAMALIKRTNLKDKPVMANTARQSVRRSNGGYQNGFNP